MTESDYNSGIHLWVEASLIRARARIAGMEATNQQRAIEGKSPAYTEEHFEKAIIEEGATHNAVVGELQRRY